MLRGKKSEVKMCQYPVTVCGDLIRLIQISQRSFSLTLTTIFSFSLLLHSPNLRNPH